MDQSRGGVAPQARRWLVVARALAWRRGKLASRAEELECLLPNRRVEVNFVTMRQP